MSWRDKAASILENTPTPAPTKPTKPISVSFDSTDPRPIPIKRHAPSTVNSTNDDEYSSADLAEMDRLLMELAELEGWSDTELTDLMDERRHMAPVNVMAQLRVVREAHRMALAPWPAPTKARLHLVLAPHRRAHLRVIRGGKNSPTDQGAA